jgi:hypothetical protein
MINPQYCCACPNICRRNCSRARNRHLKAGQTLFVRRCRAPWSLDDSKLNDWNSGRGVYFKDLNGHLLELMTMPQ